MALLNYRSEKNVQISRDFSGQTFLVANNATTLHVCLRDTVLLSVVLPIVEAAFKFILSPVTHGREQIKKVA